MKRLIPLLSLMLLRVTADDFLLLNGDRLQVRSVVLDDVDFVVRTDWEPEPIRIPVARVASVDRTETPAAPFQGRFRLHLTNGDRVEANVLGLDSDGLHLQTAWQERVRLRPEAVLTMERLPDSPRLLQGIGSRGDWIPFTPRGGAPAQVHLSEGLLHLHHQNRHSLRLSVLPPRFQLELSLRFEANRPDIPDEVRFFGLSFHEEGKVQTHLAFQRYQLLAQVRSEQKGQSVPLENWTVEIPEAPFASPHWRLKVLVDQPGKTIRVFLNGVPLKSWSPRSEELIRSNDPAWLHLMVRQAYFSVWLEQLDLWEWDGVPPPPQMPFPDPQTQDVIILRNGDRILGRVLDMAPPEALRVQMQDGKEIIFSLRQVSRISFDPQTRIAPRRHSRDVEIHHHQQSNRLTLTLTHLDDLRLRGTSDLWLEPLELPGSGISLLRPNPHMRNRPTLVPLL